jgi:hypothetical protein
VKLDLPVPSTWHRLSDDEQLARGPRVEEAYRLGDVTVVVEKMQPLPENLRTWGDRVVIGELRPEQLRTRDVADKMVAAGWRVTLFLTDVIDPATSAVIERRLHALYCFLHVGCVVVARAPTIEHMDTAGREIVPILLQARPDWTGPEVLSIAQLWEGLELAPADPDPGPRQG